MRITFEPYHISKSVDKIEFYGPENPVDKIKFSGLSLSQLTHCLAQVRCGYIVSNVEELLHCDVS